MRCARAVATDELAKKSRMNEKKRNEERNRRLTDCRQTKDNRATGPGGRQHAGRVIERKKANGKDAGARCVVAARSS